MSVIAQILNGTNLNRDAGFSSLVSSFLTEGVRSSFGNDLAITLNQCDTGMAFVECTRTSVTPNEVFLIPVWVDVPEVIDTSGNGYIIIEVDQTKINDGSANSADGTGVATVKKVAGLPSTNYLELASLASGVITDTRVPMAIDIDKLTANELIADSLLEKTGGNGVLIDEILCRDGYFDIAEGGDPATPASTHWRLFFKTDGLYIIDDAGLVSKMSAGGISTVQKAEASSVAGELFENTDEGGENLSWKSSDGNVRNLLGKSFTYGETIGANDAIGSVGELTYGFSLDATKDTYVSLIAPTTNYDTSTTLELDGGGGTTRDILLKLSLPSGLVRILSFDLKLYAIAGAAIGTAKTTTTSWVSSTVNWNTRPTYGNSLGSSSFGTTGYHTLSCTVSSRADSDFIKNNGIVVTNITNTNTVTIHSLENASGNDPLIDNIVYLGEDGKIYKAKASYQETADSFLGFAKLAGVLDDKQPVYRIGDFVPVTAVRNTNYYLSNTAGAISTSAGTNSKKVGYAVDTNLLQLRLENN